VREEKRKRRRKKEEAQPSTTVHRPLHHLQPCRVLFTRLVKIFSCSPNYKVEHIIWQWYNTYHKKVYRSRDCISLTEHDNTSVLSLSIDRYNIHTVFFVVFLYVNIFYLSFNRTWLLLDKHSSINNNGISSMVKYVCIYLTLTVIVIILIDKCIFVRIHFSCFMFSN
jgi:hypothetical protein